MLKGSCLCGAVYFTAEDKRTATSCHCSQCRKQSGHYWGSGTVENDKLTVTGDVRWYSHTPGIERGFCPTCGSFLFWKDTSEPKTSFSLGLIDGPTGLTTTRHIFTADKGDYYELADNVPQRED
ncbi:MAG: GFA family protein [Planktomarina sp.]